MTDNDNDSRSRTQRIWDLQDELHRLEEEEQVALASAKRKKRLDRWLAGKGPDTLEPKS